MAICLNVGCGLSAHPAWLNLDASPSLRLRRLPVIGDLLVKTGRIPNWPREVRYGNIVEGIAMSRDSCELVFASHVLEHLTLSDMDQALKNVRAYLRAGARFRLIMPDLEAYALAYLEQLRSPDSQKSGEAAPLFMQSSHLGLAGSRRGFMARLRESASNRRHQWLWDVPSTTLKLQETGFVDVRHCGLGESGDARFLSVEDPARHRMSFCLECVKP